MLAKWGTNEASMESESGVTNQEASIHFPLHPCSGIIHLLFLPKHVVNWFWGLELYREGSKGPGGRYDSANPFVSFPSFYADITYVNPAWIVEKNCHPILVRLAWHDAGTYDHKTKTGGPHAAMRFATGESGHASNAGYETMTCGLFHISGLVIVLPNLFQGWYLRRSF